MERKIRDIDIMVSLLESKLNSLPEDITSKFPPLQHISLDDITPIISIVSNVVNEPKQEVKNEVKQERVVELIQTDNIPQPDNKPVDEINEEQKAEEPIEEKPLTALEKLQAFVEKYEEEGIANYYKSLKLGLVPEAVIQKALLAGYNLDLVKVIIFKIRN